MPDTIDHSKQLITTVDGSLFDFDVTHGNDGRIEEAVLKRSKYDEKWSKPGETAVSLKDTGNKIEVKLADHKLLKFEYHEICELYIILNVFVL